MCERWVGDGDRLQHIDPQVPLYYSSTSSFFCCAAQPKPSVWRWLSLRHLVHNCDWNSNRDCNSNWTLPAANSKCLKPSVAPDYIIVWGPPALCRHRICTEFNPSKGQGDIPISSTGCPCFLIDGSVEGQYVTIAFKELYSQCIFLILDWVALSLLQKVMVKPWKVFVCLGFCYINLCWLFNTDSIFIQIISIISNNSV